MNRNFTHLASAFVLTIALFTTGFSQSAKRPVLKDGGEGEEFQERRKRHEEKQLMDPKTGKIPADIRKKELEFVNSMAANLQSRMRPRSNRAVGVNFPSAVGDPQASFTSRGPYNVGGRTRAFAIDINNENHLLAGGVSGGMWSSDDAGATWIRRTGLSDFASVTAIAQDKRPGHQSTWYYSTGEGIGNSASESGAPYRGDGVFKSTDNGVTWIPIFQLGSPQIYNDFKYISSLVVDSQGNILAGVYRGVYRSTDGGLTFARVFSPASTSSIYCEIYISQSNIYYASIENDGVYRSTTGAAGSWIKISPANFPAAFGRTVVYSAPSDPTILYCLVSRTTSTTGHDLWKYQYLAGDGSGVGGTWTNLTAQIPIFGSFQNSRFDTQGGYDMVVKVHPTDPNFVLIGGTSLYRSTDGFATTGNTKHIGGYEVDGIDNFSGFHHPDQHAFEFLPSNPTVAYSCHDGGVTKTADITATTVGWTSLNNGFLTTQAYAINIGPGNKVIAGFQDNGTWKANSTALNTTWADEFGGDGAACAYSKDGLHTYVTAQFGVLYRVDYNSNDQFVGFDYLTPSGSCPDDNCLFVTYFELDPNNDEYLYFAGNTTIFRNTQASTANNTRGWTELTNASTNSQISTMGISTNPANILYIGTEAGELYKVYNAHDGNPSKVNIYSGKGLPSGNVTSISVDPRDANVVTVSFSNYSILSIFRTTNGGETWTEVAGNLEQNANGSGNGPSVRWITSVGANADVYLAGTSTGLYSTKAFDGRNTVWTQVSEIGNVVVPVVRSRASDGLALVGTHGNGLYSTNYTVSTNQVVVDQKPLDINVGAELTYDVAIGNVFKSTATVPLAITVTVANNSNTSFIANTAITNNTLKLTIVPNAATGENAVITLKGTDTNGNFITTNFKATKTNPFDVGITNVTLSTNYLAINTPATVNVTIKNFGSETITSVPIDLKINNTVLVSGTFTGSIASGATATYVFTNVIPTVSGEIELTAQTTLQSDATSSNNGTTISAVALKTSTLPYAADFETSDGDWMAWQEPASPNSWVWGTPSKTNITGAGGGSKSWVTGLTGRYSNNEQSYVISPLFKSVANTTITFSMKKFTKVEEAYDGVALQYSTDLGTTWQNVGVKGENWYEANIKTDFNDVSNALNFSEGNGDCWTISDSRYVLVSNTLINQNANANILFRVVLGADGSVNDEGFSFDDVSITIVKLNQTIDFAAIPEKVIGDTPFNLSATSSSGLAINYTTNAEEISISATNQVTLLKAGRATITATQPGNANYLPATSISRDFCINPAKPTISLSNTGTPAILLTSSASTGNQWYLNDVAIPAAINQTFAAAAGGTYKVQVKAEDCSSEFSTNQAVIITGDIKPFSSSISISPNPVDGFVEVNGIEGEIKANQLFDVAGRVSSSLVFERKDKAYRASVEHLTAGVYLLRIVQADKIVQLKFIKR